MNYNNKIRKDLFINIISKYLYNFINEKTIKITKTSKWYEIKVKLN